MRYSASDKAEIIKLVQESSLSVRHTLKRLDIHRSTFYNWLKRYHESLNNVTPADLYYGRADEVLEQRQMIKQRTLAMRLQMHYDNRNESMSLMN